MKPIYPKKLQQGDIIRIIAPSQSLATIDTKVQKTSLKWFNELGLQVTFGKNVNRIDESKSSSIDARIADLQEAFLDNDVKLIMAARGGYNANQLLDVIDWRIVKENPKLFCGFSDITVLLNSIFVKTGLVTYLAPNFVTFGQANDRYTVSYFRDCFMDNQPFTLEPSAYWQDGMAATRLQNNGYLLIQEGKAKGTLIGGNLCSFNLLQGTQYFPAVDSAILCIEEDDLAEENTLFEFDRNLQSLLQQVNCPKITGIIVGRFQRKSKVTNFDLIRLFTSKKEFRSIPIIANVDFGHTFPQVAFPIGGICRIVCTQKQNSVEILRY